MTLLFVAFVYVLLFFVVAFDQWLSDHRSLRARPELDINTNRNNTTKE